MLFMGKKGTLSKEEFNRVASKAIDEALARGVKINVIPKGVQFGDEVEYKSSFAGRGKKAREIRAKRISKRGNRGAVMAKRKIIIGKPTLPIPAFSE